MANREKGEVAITIGGRAFTLCYSNNAIAELEQVADESIIGLLSRWASGGRLSLLRLMLWGGLRKFHPDLSLIDVGNMLDDTTRDEGKQIGEGIAEAIQFRLSALGIDLAPKADGEPAATDAG